MRAPLLRVCKFVEFNGECQKHLPDINNPIFLEGQRTKLLLSSRAVCYATKSDGPRAIDAGRHEQELVMLVVLIGLRKIPL